MHDVEGRQGAAAHPVWCQSGLVDVERPSEPASHHAGRLNRSGVLCSLVLDSWPQ